MKKILLGLFFVSTVMGSCAVTHFHNITTTVGSGVHYQKIIVHSDLADLDTRKIVEDSVVKEFQAIGVSATPSYTVFSPGTIYTWAVKKQTIQADGFDAGLLVKVVDSYSTTTPKDFNGERNGTPVYVMPPPVTHIDSNGVRHTWIDTNLDDAVPDWNQTAVVNPADANFTTAHFTIQTRLVDTKTFTAVWQAQTGSREGMDASGDFSLPKIMESYALTLVSELQNEGVVVAAANLESIGR
jgi:hypothetical protein